MLNSGLEFVIRGCKSKIYKPDVAIHDNVKCQSNSPALCFCKENLCNSSKSFSFHFFPKLIPFLLILIKIYFWFSGLFNWSFCKFCKFYWWFHSFFIISNAITIPISFWNIISFITRFPSNFIRLGQLLNGNNEI